MRLEADVGLLEIAEDLRGLLIGRDDVEGAAKAKLHLEADGVGVVRERQFRHVQAELIRAHIEVVELIESRGGVVEVEAIIAVDEATEVDRIRRPGRRRNRSGLLCRRAARGSLVRRSGIDLGAGGRADGQQQKTDEETASVYSHS